MSQLVHKRKWNQIFHHPSECKTNFALLYQMFTMLNGFQVAINLLTYFAYFLIRIKSVCSKLTKLFNKTNKTKIDS